MAGNAEPEFKPCRIGIDHFVANSKPQAAAIFWREGLSCIV
jgi:hypothetical protein